uniref:Uncharacterized protein n=1 Tax=Aegilops tauschii subsp. strangulata TaxID=200361 RepID=A0A453NXF7_AEGTS
TPFLRPFAPCRWMTTWTVLCVGHPFDVVSSMLEDLVPPHRPSASSSLAVDPCSCSSRCHHVLQLLRMQPPLAVPWSSSSSSSVCRSLLKLLRLPFPAQAPPAAVLCFISSDTSSSSSRAPPSSTSPVRRCWLFSSTNKKGA